MIAATVEETSMDSVVWQHYIWAAFFNT